MVSIKSKLRTLIILMVIIFIVFPLLSSVFDSLSVSMEPFKGYDIQNGFNMDRVKTDTDGEYRYCPAGVIECAVNDDLVEDDQKIFSIGDKKKGKTYEKTCGDGTNTPTCNNYFTGKTTIDKIEFKDSNGSTESINLDGDSGFTTDLSYNPLKVETDENDGLQYAYLYDGYGDKTMVTTACFLYDTSTNCIDNYKDEAADEDKDKDKDKDKNKGMKCLADNGAQVGDPLCCGQEGVLQNTKYNCPSDYPYCHGYKCGETWGRCSSESSTKNE